LSPAPIVVDSDLNRALGRRRRRDEWSPPRAEPQRIPEDPLVIKRQLACGIPFRDVRELLVNDLQIARVIRRPSGAVPQAEVIPQKGRRRPGLLPEVVYALARDHHLRREVHLFSVDVPLPCEEAAHVRSPASLAPN